MYARDGVVTLRESPSTIFSLVALLDIPITHDELRVATNRPKNASESITIQLQCPRMH